MNNVSLIGTLVADPEFAVSPGGGDTCLVRIEVPRRTIGGKREPGVIYVDVVTFGQQARVCAAQLTVGSKVGVSGMLERNDSLDLRPRQSRWEVHAHQVEFLNPEPA